MMGAKVATNYLGRRSVKDKSLKHSNKSNGLCCGKELEQLKLL